MNTKKILRKKVAEATNLASNVVVRRKTKVYERTNGDIVSLYETTFFDVSLFQKMELLQRLDNLGFYLKVHPELSVVEAKNLDFGLLYWFKIQLPRKKGISKWFSMDVNEKTDGTCRITFNSVRSKEGSK